MLKSKLRPKTGFAIVWNSASEFATLHYIAPPPSNLNHSFDTTSGKRRRTPMVFPGFVNYSPNGMSQSKIDTRTVHNAHTYIFLKLLII